MDSAQGLHKQDEVLTVSSHDVVPLSRASDIMLGHPGSDISHIPPLPQENIGEDLEVTGSIENAMQEDDESWLTLGEYKKQVVEHKQAAELSKSKSQFRLETSAEDFANDFQADAEGNQLAANEIDPDPFFRGTFNYASLDAGRCNSHTYHCKLVTNRSLVCSGAKLLNVSEGMQKADSVGFVPLVPPLELV
jgi:hypothetical protein